MLANNGIAGAVRDLARQAYAEHSQQAAYFVLQIDALLENGFAARKQRANLMACEALYVNAAIPAGA